MRKTKIICTIGPASCNTKMIEQLLDAGMNIARLNFSHGSQAEHLKHLTKLRQCAKAKGKYLGILVDIQGPKIRIGEIKNGPVTLTTGMHYVLTTEKCLGDEKRAFVGYSDLTNSVQPGSVIYLDDGLLELKVLKIDGNDVVCEVVVGGELGSYKGVTLPGIKVNLPSVTTEDVEHIRFGVEHKVDFIAASFVRKAEHVKEVKQIIDEANGSIPVISKIENNEGLNNIDEIIAESDGIMVARGDLGVEIPPEEVPLAQKMIISKANEAGIPVITATQMLDSMIRNPRPTRAEVTDVANAILDGTDCVMLSGETAIGKYPVKAVELMHAVANHLEESINYSALLDEKRSVARHNIADTISLATCQTAQDLKAKAILCFTHSGATACLLAKYRPRAPIIAVCTSVSVARRLSMVWGVHPKVVTKPNNIDEMIDYVVNAAEKIGIVNKGDIVPITAGVKTGVPGSTNLLQIYEL